MAIEQYPSGWPLPTIDGYSIEVDMGVVRTPMGSGLARQRRMYRNMPETYSWTFALEAKNFFAWQEWAKKKAFTWFQIDIFTPESSRKGTDSACTPHIARFISEIKVEPLGGDRYLRISVQAELAPRDVYTPPAVLTSDWIDAKNPADPSTPDWYWPNRIFMVASDEVVAGSPIFPAAFV